jgi:hypothetical protein
MIIELTFGPSGAIDQAKPQIRILGRHGLDRIGVLTAVREDDIVSLGSVVAQCLELLVLGHRFGVGGLQVTVRLRVLKTLIAELVPGLVSHDPGKYNRHLGLLVSCVARWRSRGLAPHQDQCRDNDQGEHDLC